MLQSCDTWCPSKVRWNYRSKHLRRDGHGIHSSIEKVKIGPGIVADASQYHHRSPAPSVSFSNAKISEPLSRMPPNSPPSIPSAKMEPGLLCKNDSVPLVSGPCRVNPSQCQASLAVSQGKNLAYIWSSGFEVCFPKSPLYYPSTDSWCMSPRVTLCSG